MNHLPRDMDDMTCVHTFSKKSGDTKLNMFTDTLGGKGFTSQDIHETRSKTFNQHASLLHHFAAPVITT